MVQRAIATRRERAASAVGGSGEGTVTGSDVEAGAGAVVVDSAATFGSDFQSGPPKRPLPKVCITRLSAHHFPFHHVNAAYDNHAHLSSTCDFLLQNFKSITIEEKLAKPAVGLWHSHGAALSSYVDDVCCPVPLE